MTLVRWNPLHEMDDLMSRFDRAVGRPSVREGAQKTTAIADWAPTVDISETDNEFRIKVELTGVPKEGVKVSVHDGVLTIKGERKMESEEEGRKYHRVERAYGRFARTFTLPDNVDEAKIDAAHKNGLLTVTLGKAVEAKPKSIEVKVA